MFKVGDRVVKARAWSERKYCKFGGEPSQVPIGTEGEIIATSEDNSFYIKFENHEHWNVDASEIDLVKSVNFDWKKLFVPA